MATNLYGISHFSYHLDALYGTVVLSVTGSQLLPEGWEMTNRGENFWMWVGKKQWGAETGLLEARCCVERDSIFSMQ